ncbi:MAG: AGE family epimerase/isomerase [Mangrovibacterium sp.]
MTFNGNRLVAEMQEELLRILEFWSTKAVDEEFGGFVGQIDGMGSVVPNATKGAVLNARILWTFSAAFRQTGNERYRLMADRAYRFLNTCFWDKTNGGLFWETDYSGHPTNTRKQAYAQGFGLYAYAEYYRAGGSTESLNYAQKLFNLLEEKFLDTKNGGYIEALSADWQPLDDMRLSAKDANSPKSMNTHLHLLEPYTNLYRAWPNERLKSRILDLIDIFQTRIIDPKTGHFNLFFDWDWTVQSTIVSYGHDIEGAWLLHEAALETGNKAVIDRVRQTAIRLVDTTLNEGLAADGTLRYEREGAHVDTDRHWWPQAEAMVGLMDAWEIIPNDNYLQRLQTIWAFVKNKLVDHEKGEWFWSVDAQGNPNLLNDKAGFWKCPYHNSRALMELITRLSGFKN